MAGPAENGATSDEKASLPEVLDDKQRLREHAAKLYGLGFKRAEIARALLDYLVPDDGRPMDQRMTAARQKVKRWEVQPTFRDMVHERALVALDMQGPNIYEAIGRQAKRGKIDAAKLALELTGRYSPKGDHQPAQVAVVFTGLDRPVGARARVLDPGEDVAQIEGSATEDED